MPTQKSVLSYCLFTYLFMYTSLTGVFCNVSHLSGCSLISKLTVAQQAGFEVSLLLGLWSVGVHAFGRGICQKQVFAFWSWRTLETNIP